MLNTKYAREIVPPVEIAECRIERIFVKKLEQEELRFSWWPKGKFAPRPLDLPERDFLELFAKACKAELISKEGQKWLLRALEKSLS